MKHLEDSSLVDKLKAQMKRRNINARELAERAGVGRSFVYDILNGKSVNPTASRLASIAEVLGVNVTYLYGEEEDDTTLAMPGDVSELVAISSVNVEASAGGGTLVTSELEGKPYYFHRSWIENKLKTKSANLRVIFVKGDSMYPTLSDQDIILVDISRHSPTPPGIFALFDGVGLVVKRLESISDGDDPKVRIISDNAHYGSYERHMSDINIIGRVVWFARDLV